MIKHLPALALILAIVMGSAAAADARDPSFCSLRDPQNTISKLFPEATGYRLVSRDLSPADREAVRRALPAALDFHGAGTQDLYIVLDADKPIGLVQVRTEQAHWGLTELVWGLDMNLRVHGYSFQRCREPSRPVLESSRFRELVEGKNRDELASYFDHGTGKLDTARVDVPADARPLARTLLRSGLTAIAVAGAVWNDEVAALHK